MLRAGCEVIPARVNGRRRVYTAAEFGAPRGRAKLDVVAAERIPVLITLRPLTGSSGNGSKGSVAAETFDRRQCQLCPVGTRNPPFRLRPRPALSRDFYNLRKWARPPSISGQNECRFSHPQRKFGAAFSITESPGALERADGRPPPAERVGASRWQVSAAAPTRRPKNARWRN
jgi:hypothetical protein